MKRRDFLHRVLVGGGLAGYQALSGNALSATEKSQSRASTDAARWAESRGPIIDVHMHAYPPEVAIPALGNPATGKLPGLKDGRAHMQACLAEMKRLNIVKGVVSGGSGDRLAVAALWRDAAPDRFIVGAGLRGSEEIPLPDLSVLRKAFEDRRMHVLGELTPQYAGLTLDDPKYEPYLALAEELDVPVALHTGMGPPGISYDPCCHGYRARLGNPGLIEEVFNRHPKLRVSLMHAGWPYLQDTLAILISYPQVYVDIGATNWAVARPAFHAYLNGLVQPGFANRIMFGSDQMFWPEAISMAVNAVDSAPFLTQAQKRDIFYNNAVRFFRLENLKDVNG